MKLLKNKTYQDLLNANSELSAVSNGLERIVYDLEKIAKGLELKVKRLEAKILDLEEEKSSFNLTRDANGRFRTIETRPKNENPKSIAKKYLGSKITIDCMIGKVCGYDNIDILIGLDNEFGHNAFVFNGTVKLVTYQSYWWVGLKEVKKQLK